MVLGSGTGARGRTAGNTVGGGQGPGVIEGISTLGVGTGFRSGDNDSAAEYQGRRREGGVSGGDCRGGIGENTVGRGEAGINATVTSRPKGRSFNRCHGWKGSRVLKFSCSSFEETVNFNVGVCNRGAILKGRVDLWLMFVGEDSQKIVGCLLEILVLGEF